MKGQPTEIWQIYNRANSTLEIPVYQRNYDWGITQCTRLLEDLEHLATADPVKHPKHFFGAVVGKAESSWKWVVIDGQQRLTTISLLILALTHAVDAGEIIPSKDPELARKLIDDFLLVDADPRNLKFKLKPVKNDAAAYKALFGPEDEYLESSNVTVNYRYFRQQLSSTDLDAGQIWDAICRLEVMHLDLESHDDPQRIFESLNSTGLNLSEADKIRNYVLMNLQLDEQERLYEDRWNPIEENVDYNTDWFIRWYLTAKTGKTPKEADIFEAFKRYAVRSGTGRAKILDDMFEYSKNSRAITHAATGFSAVDRRLHRANLIIGDVVHPFLMPVVADAKSGLISENDLLGVIRVIESYLFRRVTCSIPSGAVNKIMATTYSEMRKLRTDDQPYTELLTYVLRRRDGGSGRIPTDAEFRDSFSTRDFYHVRPNTRRYLFDVLENGESKDVRDIADGINKNDLTIEHIMPQTLTTTWKQELGQSAEQVHETWENRIGNLTITGYNSAYSNSSFRKKLEIEHGFAVSPYRLNADVKSATQWNEDAIRARSNRLTDLALEYWTYIETDFAPPEVVRPTEPLGVDTSFRGRDVTAYQFEDASETVTDWSDLIPKLLTVLLQQYRSTLLTYAAKEALLTTTPESHPKSRNLRIIDPSFGVFVNNNTDAKISLLRRIFSHLGIDNDELIFTLRPDKSTATTVNETISQIPKLNKFSALTKFSDAVAEIAALQTDSSYTSDLRAEFASEFSVFERDAWQHDIGEQPLSVFTESTPVDEMTAEQVLGVITGLHASEKYLGPGAVHNSLIDGTMHSYLLRLQEIG